MTHTPLPMRVPPALRHLPEWWVAIIDRALSAGNYQAAAEAAQELRRLGVEVRYMRTAHDEEAGDAPPR